MRLYAKGINVRNKRDDFGFLDWNIYFFLRRVII